MEDDKDNVTTNTEDKNNSDSNANEKIDMEQMKDLIPIYTDNSGRQVVDAQELYDALELADGCFSDWIQDKLIRMKAEEGVDYVKLPIGKVGKNDVFLYQITLDIAKRLATIAGATCEANSRTLEISNAMQLYFLECEKIALSKQSQPSEPLPGTYAAALRRLADEVEKNEKLEEENAVLKPKGDYYDSVLDPQDENFKKLITMTDIAKALGFSSARTFNKKLNELSLIFKQGREWHLYSNYEWLIQEKYFGYQISEYGQTLKVYEKGREWLIQFLHEHGVDCKPVKKLFENSCVLETGDHSPLKHNPYPPDFIKNSFKEHIEYRKMKLKENKLNNAKKASEAKKKPVVGVHVKTGEIVRFESANDAAREIGGISPEAIRLCLKGDTKSSAGYKWYYAKDYDGK